MSHKFSSITPVDILCSTSYDELIFNNTVDRIFSAEVFSVSEKIIPATERKIDGTFSSIITGYVSIEFSFRHIFSPKCQVYTLGFDVIKDIIELDGSNISSNQIQNACAILHSIGVIYRLPCAVKFQYPPIEMPQIRISGWGIEAAQEILNISPDKNSVLRENIESKLKKFSCEYIELIKACSTDRRPLDVQRIHEINSKVPIPIVT